MDSVAGPPPPLWSLRETAVFIDLDGTLIELAPRPDLINVPAGLPQQLRDLSTFLEGALAILSGRSVVAVEDMLGPVPIILCGVHGAELKEPGKPIQYLGQPVPSALRSGIEALAIRWPALLVEDKGQAMAVHIRQSPDLATDVAAALDALVSHLGPDHQVMRGDAVFEVKPKALSKGTALRQLMLRPDFATRRPVFLGDDTTDEDGFIAAAALGGDAIAVGLRHSATAKWRLASPLAARQWLRDFAAQGFH
jgi:trehalose 6-phosphate phosphatase